MLDAFRLISPLQVIFRTEIEFTVDCFVELNTAQREAFQRKIGDSNERIYRLVPLEPTVVERQESQVTVELSIVTESERQLMLEAVDFVYRASAEIPDKSATFQQRLAYLRPRLPRVVIGDEG
jgi:hypothetical protein